ncbi:tyrosine-type recombinase/integrase [Lysinibacillus sp. NPDC094177]|uniref:tyrosine-type recombinase/integrase n=1 Tax=Lysinibacillus sp. NPDC094177 TaxID=3390580 RepID=UPI003D012148
MKEKDKFKAIKEYKNKDGKTLYMFKIYLGINKSTRKRIETTRRGFKTRTAAKSAYTQMKANAIDGGISTSTQKYEDVYKKWLSSYKVKVKASTYNKTTQIFRDHILPLLGHIKIKDISFNICENAATEWYGKIEYHEKIQHYSACVFDYAIKLGILQSNPMKLTDIIEKNHGKRLSHYSREELIEFLEAAKKESLKKYAYLRVMSYTGIRRAEGFALSWCDVNFEKNEITVNNAVSYNENGQLIITDTKTSDLRILIIDDKTLNILKEWRKLQMDVYGEIDDDDLIFPNAQNSICHPSKAWDWCDEIQEKYNFKRLSPHGFRRTHATMYHNSGASHYEIKKRLGHSFKDVTYGIYVIETDEPKTHAFQRFIEYMKY